MSASLAQAATPLDVPPHPPAAPPAAVTPPDDLARSDPFLARANADMQAAFRADMAQISLDAQIGFSESQHLWTRYANQQCQMAQDAPAPRALRGARRETLEQCLTRAALARQTELKNALQTVGPWVFLRTTNHRIRPAHIEHAPAVVEEAVSTLQIARPATETERRWNLVVARQLDQTLTNAYDRADGDQRPLSFEARDTSVQAGVDVVAVTPDLIDVVIRASADPVGPPPPQASARTLIWSVRMGRALDPTDIFDPRAPWRPSLAQIALDRLVFAASGATPRVTLQTMTALAADPGRWSLRASGLQLDFRPGELGAGIGAATAVAPWTLLAPYLKRPMLIDPAGVTEAAR